jgi:hypothetical protein
MSGRISGQNTDRVDGELIYFGGTHICDYCTGFESTKVQDGVEEG